MLSIMRWCDYPGDDIAAKAAGRPYLDFPDSWFSMLSRDHNLNQDPWFEKFVREVDECDIPMPNVIRMLDTGETHSFDRVSTGVKALWLMYYYPDRWLYPSQWLGENCYQSMLDIGAEKDLIVLNDSKMLISEIDGYCMDKCRGQFRDFKRGTIYTIIPGGEVCWNFDIMEDDADEVCN